MEDTDWRPSPCPQCGKLREAAKTPVCENPLCGLAVSQQRTLKPQEQNEKRYVVCLNGSAPYIVTGKEELIQATRAGGEGDTYYELGPEVKIETTVKVVNTKPVYREGSYREETR